MSECVLTELPVVNNCLNTKCMWHATRAKQHCILINQEEHPEEIVLKEVAKLKGIPIYSMSVAIKKGESRIRKILLIDEYVNYIKIYASRYRLTHRLKEKTCKNFLDEYPFNVPELNIDENVLNFMFAPKMYKSFLYQQCLTRVPKLRNLLGVSLERFEKIKTKIINTQGVTQ